MFHTLLALIKIPSTSLLRARGGSKKRRGIRSLLNKLRNSSVDSLASQPPAAPSASAPTDPTAARLARARALIQEGHLGRATRSLFQPPIPPIDNGVKAALDQLHPPSSGPAPACPPDAQELHQVDLKVLSRLIRSSLANGAAPGGSSSLP